MAKVSTYTPMVAIVGDGLNMTECQVNVNSSAPAPGSQALVNGWNTINVPTGAAGLKIAPPPGNALALRIGDAGGMDTGVGISPTLETCLALAAGQTTVGLKAGGSVTVGLIWF